MKVPYAVRKLLYADPAISDAAKTLLTVLAGFTKGGQTDCDLTNSDLAKASGNSPRTVERPLAELRALGWIAYAESRAHARIIALSCPQICGVMPAKQREPARKSAGPIKEVPVKNQILTRKAKPSKSPDPRHHELAVLCQKAWLSKNPDRPTAPWNGHEGSVLARLLRENQAWVVGDFARCLANWLDSDVNHAEMPARWIRRLPEYASGPLDRYGKPKGKSAAKEREDRTYAAIDRVFAEMDKVPEGELPFDRTH